MDPLKKTNARDPEKYYRSLSRVEDRTEKCLVNKNFPNFCSKHRQPTCANKKPSHCAWQGSLETIPFNARIKLSGREGAQPRTYILTGGKKYCEECMGNVIEAVAAFRKMGEYGTDEIYMGKQTPAEIQFLRDEQAKRDRGCEAPEEEGRK